MAIFRKLMILLATLLVISTVPMACVNNPKIKAPVNSELEPRVLGRWDALMARHFDEAYEYLSPAYRKLFPIGHYLSKTGSSVIWLSADITNIQFNDNRAEVTIDLKYELNTGHKKASS